MTKTVLLAVVALGLGGCAVASVASTAVDVGVGVASTAVDVSAGVAKTAVHTVTGSDDNKKQ